MTACLIPLSRFWFSLIIGIPSPFLFPFPSALITQVFVLRLHPLNCGRGGGSINLRYGVLGSALLLALTPIALVLPAYCPLFLLAVSGSVEASGQAKSPSTPVPYPPPTCTPPPTPLVSQ
ncbi:hypothetical protein BDP81DRAFT_125321 [Colletotrichum phormii]|uniref:Uncharacterized protein n=1 Tax=Colletotrichum phormii TaxID=359342 RepID=A0AAJ0A2L4_9PEZI|nr:uncharacterized protein BDP81DRAFT_125321 [Colletotrichum phormii]KAK1640967.1 hypothetical protein BDP81DRAFT_125321 [Colletotrichum phormii]